MNKTNFMAEKRNVRTYKITDKAYNDAVQKCIKKGKFLSQLVEAYVFHLAYFKETPTFTLEPENKGGKK